MTDVRTSCFLCLEERTPTPALGLMALRFKYPDGRDQTVAVCYEHFQKQTGHHPLHGFPRA